MSAKAGLVVSCPLCGLVGARLWIRHGEWTVVRCTGCDLRITWPRPDEGTLARIYEDEGYYDSGGMGHTASGAWLERARGILGALQTRPGSVLDLGAGEGHFVHALREMGLMAEGVEPSPAGRAAARRLYGLDLLCQVSHDLHSRFDLVTMIHSLEHMANPVHTLAQAKELLKPSGMVFIEVPHAGSVDMRWPRRRREILSLPVHLYHFVPATLVRVVEGAGLRIVDLRLANPDILEWLLKVRARWRPPKGPGEVGVRAGGGVDSAAPYRTSGRARSLWASRVLPWVRRYCPGGQLQLVATRIS